MGSKESGRGRNKYTPEVHAEIIRNLKLGAFRKHAAEAAGIAHETFVEWMRLAKVGKEPYVQLLQDVEQAMAEDALRNQTIITKAAGGPHNGDWKAAAWNLERKHPQLYTPALQQLKDADKDAGKPHSPWLQRPSNDTTKPVKYNA